MLWLQEIRFSSSMISWLLEVRDVRDSVPVLGFLSGIFFSDTVMAIKLKSHIHICVTELQVLVFFLLVCEGWGPSFIGF